MDDNPYSSPSALPGHHGVKDSSLLHRIFFVRPGSVPVWVVADHREGTDLICFFIGVVGLFACALMIALWWTIPVVIFLAYVFTTRVYYPFLKVELQGRRRRRARFRDEPIGDADDEGASSTASHL
jgi:hypothetical protein